ECPERVVTIVKMMEEEGLLSRCVQVEVRGFISILGKEYIDRMKSTQKMTVEELKSVSEDYDSVYLHPESFTCACLGAGSLLQLVDKVMTSELLNGFSVCRPPGHHAHADKMNGYCMFNNLAVAARYAQKHHAVQRVLIVDWDVHHGQGIQHIFQQDPSVLYFSVHRYEGGSFWPHMPESDSSAVGLGAGQGYNINLPWKKVQNFFQPQLVLVAAGFDSVVGDPKVSMCVPCQGGYNLQATAAGACASLKALLGDPCPHLPCPGAPSESGLKSISDTVSALYPFWTSLQTLEGGPLSEKEPLPSPVCVEIKLESSSLGTGLVYDQRMMEHHNMWNSHHPELPQRIFRIFSCHENLGLVTRCERIPARLATEDELMLCHGSAHIATIKSTEQMKPRDLHRLCDEYNSIYISNESYKCALLAAGACFNCARAVLTGQVRNAVAIVRPPGHHAESDTACGFCFFNTAALTARYAQSITHEALRVLIVDWDVHHGNGTQHIFESDCSVLYISLHRYENATFFPSSEDANYNKVGQGRGTGYNVNIPWNGAKMGDPEYLAAFHNIVMPVAREFAPELVLVSAGFDAARGDPLGGYQVTPECYAHLTHQLLSLAAGRVLIILEGGYNLTSISESMAMCTSMLLGDTPPLLPPLPPPHPNATLTINNVLRAHAPYWRSLRIQSKAAVSFASDMVVQFGHAAHCFMTVLWFLYSLLLESNMMSNLTHLSFLSLVNMPCRCQHGASVLISVPESLRLSLPSLKPKGKRPSAGKKSPPHITPDQRRQQSIPVTTSPASPATAQEDSGLDELTQGLCLLDLSTSSSANSSPTSVPVGGARPKVKPSPQRDAMAMQEVSPLKVMERDSEEDGMKAESTAVKEEKQVNIGISLMSSCRFSVQDTMYVVEPLSWCPHLDSVRPVPPGGMDVFRPCEECGAEMENWICLCCYKVLCGRFVNEHMVTHSQVSGHALVLSFADLSVWCYPCESYVHNKMLYEAKNSAHLTKFGEEIPPIN
uniref:Protein deacetylase HDAC6 n=1 Tax=Electrophorus electricus TaxID=8005 RepID=A0A4W4E5Y8_ELEEL